MEKKNIMQIFLSYLTTDSIEYVGFFFARRPSTTISMGQSL